MSEIKILGIIDEEGYELDNRVYSGGGCPTIRAGNARIKTVVKMAEVRIIGNMDNTLDNTFESANRVYDKEGLSPTIPTCAGGAYNRRLSKKQNVLVDYLRINGAGNFINKIEFIRAILHLLNRLTFQKEVINTSLQAVAEILITLATDRKALQWNRD